MAPFCGCSSQKLSFGLAGLLLLSCAGSDSPLSGSPCSTGDGAGFVAFLSVLPGPGGIGSSYQVRTAKVDGKCDAPISQSAENSYSASWHGPSRKVATSESRSGSLRLILHDLATGSETALDTGDLLVSNPAISPSGTTIAFEGRGPTGDSDIYMITVGGGTPIPLTTNPKVDAGPAWAPGEAAIYFVSNRTGVFDIWSVDSSGLNETRITTNSDILGKPCVSPDGKQLAYARWVPGGTEVVVLTLAGGAKRVIGLPDDSEPAFDSTGTMLAVRTSRFGGNDVVILDAATGVLLSRVTDGTYRAGLPAFPR
jgi:TolB protein